MSLFSSHQSMLLLASWVISFQQLLYLPLSPHLSIYKIQMGFHHSPTQSVCAVSSSFVSSFGIYFLFCPLEDLSPPPPTALAVSLWHTPSISHHQESLPFTLNSPEFPSHLPPAFHS